MNIKPAISYLFWEAKKTLIIYYLVIYGIYLLYFISSVIFAPLGFNGHVEGLESASVIFIFVFGLNFFKNQFRMLQQNGLSRKTQFLCSGIVLLLITSAILAVIDCLNSFVLQRTSDFSMFQMYYYHRYGAGAGSPRAVLEGLIWSFFVYAMFGMIGYFITMLYYRMNSSLKVVVSIGVPVFFLIGLPVLDYNLIHVEIIEGIYNLFVLASGFGVANPWNAVISSAIVIALCAGAGFLLIRRAPVKEQA